MLIQLKKDNAPKLAGHYLCKRPSSPRPEVAAVRCERGQLIMLCGLGIFPVSHCEKDALWSDAIEFAD